MKNVNNDHLSNQKHPNKSVETILQIIDISHTILYDEIKAQSEFLELINACVSHELRNPLNSIIARNIEKSVLYNQLLEILNRMNNNEVLDKCVSEMKSIILKLDEGMKV